MNKIKLMYDLAQTMRKKENINAAVKLEVKKDDKRKLYVETEFEKDLTNCGCHPMGMMGAHRHGLDFMKKEGFDFQRSCSPEERDGKCQGPRPDFEKLRGFRNHHSFKPQDVFTKMSFVFGVLDAIEVEDKKDGSAILKLNCKNIPEELKQIIEEKKAEREKMREEMKEEMKEYLENCKEGMERKPHGANPMHYLKDMKDPEFEIVVTVNKNKEIEKLTLNAKGEGKDEKEKDQTMELLFESNFTW